MLGLLCLLLSPTAVAAPAAPAAAPAARWPFRRRRRVPPQTYYFDPRQPAYFVNPHKPK